MFKDFWKTVLVKGLQKIKPRFKKASWRRKSSSVEPLRGDEEIDPVKLLADLIEANPQARVTDPADTLLGELPSAGYKSYKAGKKFKSNLNTIYSGKNFEPST